MKSLNKIIFDYFDSNLSNILFIFIISFHLLCINFYPVNDEFIFPIGATLIDTFNKNNIEYFFDFNANTLGFSIFTNLLSKITSIDYYLSGKLLSILGIILLITGTINLINFLGIQIKKDFFFLILLFNPLIFNFSFRATPDFFSMALALFSISILLKKTNIIVAFLGVLFFSSAIIVKPFNGILSLLLLYDFNLKKILIKNNIRILFLLFCIYLISILYFSANKLLFNFYLIPQNFNLSEKFLVINYLVKFISYIGILNLFLMPLYLSFLINDIKKNKFKYLILVSLSIIISNFLFKTGELDFGFITKYLNENFFLLILSTSFIIYLNLIYLVNKKKLFKNDFFQVFFISVFIFFGLLSNFHAAQRYILILIPISTIFFYLFISNKYDIIITIVLYVFMNIPIFMNYYYTQQNIGQVISFLEENKLYSETHPGYLGQHALNYFITGYGENSLILNKGILFDNNKKFTITDQAPKFKENIIFISDTKNFLNKDKNLYVINND